MYVTACGDFRSEPPEKCTSNDTKFYHFGGSKPSTARLIGILLMVKEYVGVASGVKLKVGKLVTVVWKGQHQL